jgi:hypothetical protein
MHDESGDVAISRWLCQAGPGAIGETTAAVCVFAGRHGSQLPTLTGVTAAVSEALDEIFAAGTALCAGSPDTVVDAAADREWLTVRLQGPGHWPADATEMRLRDLADRAEISFDEPSATMTVLFEFPSGASVTPGTEPCPAPGLRRRKASRPRRAALSQARRRRR